MRKHLLLRAYNNLPSDFLLTEGERPFAAKPFCEEDTLPKITREGRKFGIAIIVASQGMADFHQDVLGTAGTKVIFRMNFPDSKKVAGFIRSASGQDQASRIEQLAVGLAYVQTPEMNFGAVVKMHPLKHS